MKTRKIILLAIIAGLSITSCKGEELCRSELSEAKKQSIPYEKGQIISFTNAEGQTIDMTVTESKLDWWKETEGFYSDYRLSQIKTATLKSIADNLEIPRYRRLVVCGLLNRASFYKRRTLSVYFTTGCKPAGAGGFQIIESKKLYFDYGYW